MNAIAPGFVWTGNTLLILQGLMNSVIDSTPVGFGHPDNGRGVPRLASPSAGLHLTGDVLDIKSGLAM